LPGGTGHLGGRAGVELLARGLDAQAAAARHRVARVEREVDEHLADLPLVDAHEGRASSSSAASSRMSSPMTRRSIRPMSSMTGLRSSTHGLSALLRPNERSCVGQIGRPWRPRS
jgi:hypothetical protein